MHSSEKTSTAISVRTSPPETALGGLDVLPRVLLKHQVTYFPANPSFLSFLDCPSVGPALKGSQGVSEEGG